MNKEKLKLWLDALRSGEYQQGKGHLANIDEERSESYCCLGVACEVAIKDGLGLIKNIGPRNVINYGLARESGFLPNEVQQWLGHDEGNVMVDFTDGESHTREEHVAFLNDSGKWTFEQIADALEAKYLTEETA